MRRASPDRAGASRPSLFAYWRTCISRFPDVRPLRDAPPSTTAFIELRASEARDQGAEPAPPDPAVDGLRSDGVSLKRAVIVAEDSRFWEHAGIDVEEIERSIELDWRDNRLARGGSTITQQLAKNLYLRRRRTRSASCARAVHHAPARGRAEQKRILELYLNEIEVGRWRCTAPMPRRAGTSATSATGLGPDQSRAARRRHHQPAAAEPPARPTRRLISRQRLIRSRMGSVTPPESTKAGRHGSGARDGAPSWTPGRRRHRRPPANPGSRPRSHHTRRRLKASPVPDPDAPRIAAGGAHRPGSAIGSCEEWASCDTRGWHW